MPRSLAYQARRLDWQSPPLKFFRIAWPGRHSSQPSAIGLELAVEVVTLFAVLREIQTGGFVLADSGAGP